MYRVPIVLFAVCIPAMSPTYELEALSSMEDALHALRSGPEPNELVFSPSIEHIVRAHLSPDGPVLKDNVPLNLHHLGRLTALSLHDQTFQSFRIFRNTRLRSLRMYSCQIEDFNGIEFLGGIKELHLRNCQIKDISMITELSELTSLSLTDNLVADISALSRCRVLTWIDLRNNRIESLSALRQLRTLKYVDLRDNPLGANSNDGDIQAIKANNPGVRILLGKQSDLSQAHLNQLLSARANIAEFALCGRFQYTDGLFPFLPHVSDEISEALTCLGKGDDKEYLVDIAALLMKYAVEIERYYRPGPVWSRGEEPLLDAFMDEVGLKVNLEGMPLQYIVNWIHDNRDRLAPSFVLDTQIERYDLLLLELKRKGIYGPRDKAQDAQ